MANEGSTKPTYSELEAEILRVRGLLQRQWISVEERLPEENVRVFAYGLLAGACTAVYAYPSRWYGDGMPSEPAITHWRPIDPPTFPQSSSLMSQGAESADIGKLDTADKSGVEIGKVNSADEKGSAETGGEKAAANPQLVIACLEEAIELFELDDEVNTPGTDSWLWRLKSEQALIAYAEAEASPTFPRPSQNQTVSSGVEGAHEGTTVDKSGASPELLPTQLDTKAE